MFHLFKIRLMLIFILDLKCLKGSIGKNNENIQASFNE